MNGAALARDCVDCGRANTMKLQNALGTQPKNIQLVYVCYACGATLKIPPNRVLSRESTEHSRR
jgi:DNA-directed RNA polymerase subunit RPC12/RpoP